MLESFPIHGFHMISYDFIIFHLISSDFVLMCFQSVFMRCCCPDFRIEHGAADVDCRDRVGWMLDVHSMECILRRAEGQLRTSSVAFGG